MTAPSTDKIPFVVIGDSPTIHSGLARIARDLCAHLYRSFALVGNPGEEGYTPPVAHIELVQVGWQPTAGGQAWRGPWSLVTFSDTDDWGARTLYRVLQQFDPPGVVLAVWDASRIFEFRAMVQNLGWQLWVYPALDAVNDAGRIGGPADEVIVEADRVAAYGEWSRGVYQRIRDAAVDGPAGLTPASAGYEHDVAALPHGITNFWQPAEAPVADYHPHRIGCVAANQARKDLPLVFRTLRELRRTHDDAALWLHTSAPIAHWSIPELLDVYGFKDDKDVLVTYTDQQDTPYPDLWLREMYRSCSVTIAPGRGEGFCYPIAESHACGVRAVHIDYAGGAELGPVCVLPREYTREGVFALKRPVLDAECFADGVVAVWAEPEPHARLAVKHTERYRWDRVWPLWEAWIAAGLERAK